MKPRGNASDPLDGPDMVVRDEQNAEMWVYTALLAEIFTMHRAIPTVSHRLAVPMLEDTKRDSF